MKIACVVEGKAEYYSIPKIVGRLGHQPILILTFNGGNGETCPWDALIKSRVIPRILGAARKNPDKVLLVLDRESRDQCPPELAKTAARLIQIALQAENCTACVAIVVCDRKFENLLMADTALVDSFRFMRTKFSERVGECTDQKNVVRLFNECCEPGNSYSKVEHATAIAQKMALHDAAVLTRSRSLRKLIKELTS